MHISNSYNSNLQLVLPVLLGDVSSKVRSWGDEGIIDPFKDVYNVSRNPTLPQPV